MRNQIEARAAAFARSVTRVCQIVAERPSGLTPGKQLLDAATSAAANYRAAGRARSAREFVAKLGIANEESDEALYWLEHIAGTNLSHGLELDSLLQEAAELRAIFAASYATARRNRDRTERKGGRTSRDPKERH